MERYFKPIEKKEIPPLEPFPDSDLVWMNKISIKQETNVNSYFGSIKKNVVLDWISVIKTDKSECRIMNNWMSKEDSKNLSEELITNDNRFERNARNSRGIMHRSIGFFSNVSSGYSYTHQTSKSSRLTPLLTDVLERVNNEIGCNFNGILVNIYHDGTDSIGEHADDIKNLSNKHVICLTLGGSRILRLRNNAMGKEDLWYTSSSQTKNLLAYGKSIDVTTQDGQLLDMNGDFQLQFKHGIPQQTKVKTTRISLTFRCHKQDIII